MLVLCWNLNCQYPTFDSWLSLWLIKLWSMLDLLASTRPTSKSDRPHGELSPNLMLAVGRTVTASIDIFTDCKIANRIAGCDRVRHPPPILNSTNSNASCDARLHRKGGCPVHQLARSWLQYRFTRASVQRASKSKQRASQTFSSRLPRVSVS